METKWLHRVGEIIGVLTEHSSNYLVFKHEHEPGKYAWEYYCWVRLENDKLIVSTRNSWDREAKETPLEDLWLRLEYLIPEKNKIRSRYEPSLYLLENVWPRELDSGAAFKKEEIAKIDLW